MDTEPLNPRLTRLRGLDPERMLGVLDGDLRESLPQIPGWHVSGVAGEGGSGIVWRAARLTDGIQAAIKIASPDDPETVESIKREAGFLRDLRHSHIVGLLETGPLSHGEEEGGLYLAMEFIDGPTLVHEMLTGTPPRGAWQPASARQGVDVRADAIIRRARRCRRHSD